MTAPHSLPWEIGATDIPLSAAEVHVWRTRLDVPETRLRSYESTLAADERERAARYRFERDRAHFTAARGFLRALLGRYLPVDPQQVRFVYGARGKPALAAPYRDTGLRFNLSHAHDLAVCGIARDREIGVDIEHVRPVAEAESIARQFFSPYEVAALQALPAEEWEIGFFSCWTRKEAYLKACGDGLARPLDQFDVSVGPRYPAQLLRVEGNTAEVARWSLVALAPAPGYIGALCVEGSAGEVICRAWAS